LKRIGFRSPLIAPSDPGERSGRIIHAMSSRPLTVVQVVPMLESGGVERGTVEVAAALIAQGHRSIVISGGGRLVEQLTRDGSEHVQWPIGKKNPLTLRFVRKLRRLLRERKVDILHARSRVPAWVAYLAWRGMNAHDRPRFVTTVHSIYSVNRYSAVMTFGERVISLSETTDRYIRENYPKTDPQRIVRIARGVDPAEFPHGHQPSDEWHAQFRAEFPAAAARNGPLLMLPGRVVPRKGHLDFLELLAMLHSRGMAAHGLIVGGQKRPRSRYSRRVHAAVQTLGLDPHVSFTGARADIVDFYAAATIVMILSGHPEEAFGRTALEALSIGTPVIGYDIGGIGETLAAILPEGRVPLGDLDALTERVTQFIQNPPSITPITTFTRQEMLDRTITLYESLAGTMPRRARSSQRTGPSSG
jgi:glycosyltransferase involved in cell wall biosynthesis